jgi:hypothetical protein
MAYYRNTSPGRRRSYGSREESSIYSYEYDRHPEQRQQSNRYEDGSCLRRGELEYRARGEVHYGSTGNRTTDQYSHQYHHDRYDRHQQQSYAIRDGHQWQQGRLNYTNGQDQQSLYQENWHQRQRGSSRQQKKAEKAEKKEKQSKRPDTHWVDNPGRLGGVHLYTLPEGDSPCQGVEQVKNPTGKHHKDWIKIHLGEEAAKEATEVLVRLPRDISQLVDALTWFLRMAEPLLNIRQTKTLNIGIAVTLHTGAKHESFNQTTSLHITCSNRALTITEETLVSLMGDQDHPASRILSSLFADPLQRIRLHGYHACNIVACLARLGFKSTVFDSATSVREEETRELEHVCTVVAAEVKKDVILAKPFFKGDSENPQTHTIADLREAYLCEILGSLRPSLTIASSIGAHHNQVMAVESMLRAADVSYINGRDRGCRELAFDLKQSEFVQDAVDDEKGYSCVSHLRLYIPSRQQIPLASKRQVVKFDLVYHYWDDDINCTGEKHEGIYSIMYGIAFRVVGNQIYIVFPKGIRTMSGYNNIPSQVFTELKLGRDPPAHWQHAYPALNPFQSKRLEVKKVTIHGQAEPSVKEINTYAHANKLLKPTSSVFGTETICKRH